MTRRAPGGPAVTVQYATGGRWCIGLSVQNHRQGVYVPAGNTLARNGVYDHEATFVQGDQHAAPQLIHRAEQPVQAGGGLQIRADLQPPGRVIPTRLPTAYNLRTWR